MGDLGAIEAVSENELRILKYGAASTPCQAPSAMRDPKIRHTFCDRRNCHLDQGHLIVCESCA